MRFLRSCTCVGPERIVGVACVALAFLLLSVKAAVAQCGEIAFQELAPQAFIVENIARTAQTELRWPTMSDVLRPAAIASIDWSVSACPDDSVTVSNTIANLTLLWRESLVEQDDAAVLDLVEHGRTRAPSACAAIGRAQLRARVAVAWSAANAYVGFGANPDLALVASMQQNARYAHIEALLANVASGLGMDLPALSTNLARWSLRYGDAAAEARSQSITPSCGSDVPIAR